jgi:two-component system cell cycle sensor histidine kinase/response regulator CckA
MKIDEPTRGTVLVVDDEPGVRALARRILEGGGYGVLEAGNGVEALEVIASSARVDFLMADLDMPVMRGEEMAMKIRALRPDLRVLYVTAHSEVLFKVRPELIEGEAFLDKPFTVRGLLEAVSLLKVGFINEPPPPPPPTGLARVWQVLKGRRSR